jgi:hypothetical protein
MNENFSLISNSVNGGGVDFSMKFNLEAVLSAVTRNAHE